MPDAVNLQPNTMSRLWHQISLPTNGRYIVENAINNDVIYYNLQSVFIIGSGP